MTTELTSRLTLIRAHCTTVIEQAKLATEGPWKISNYRPYQIIARPPSESTYEVGDDKFPAICFPEKRENALFVATSRQFTPAAAEAVLVMLDLVEPRAQQREQSITRFRRNHPDCLPTPEFDQEYTSILAALAAKFDYLWK